MLLANKLAEKLRPCVIRNYTSIGASDFRIIADGEYVGVHRVRQVYIAEVPHVEIAFCHVPRGAFLDYLRELPDEKIDCVQNIIADDAGVRGAYTLMAEINKIAVDKNFDFVSAFSLEDTAAVVLSMRGGRTQ